MKIVIEIPKKLYEYMTHSATISNKEAVQWFVDFHKRIFVDGTPLPKGHGKIVDIKPLMVGLYEGMGKETFSPIEVYKMLDEECRVIIEADKEGADNEDSD